MDRLVKEGSLPSVPRSKGCINCVSRKTRCDGRRPTCRACEDRKQKCRGYRRDEFVFMAEGWRAPGVASRVANGPPETTIQNQARRRTEGQGTRRALLASRRPARKAMISPGYEGRRHDNISSIAPSRMLKPEPMAIYVSFFLSQFTPDAPRTALVLIQNCRRYLGQLLDRPLPSGNEHNASYSHPVTDAAEALVMTYFGKLHGSDLLIRESLASYTRALKSLSVKLDEVQSIGLGSLEEDEWTHLVFSCIFLTFWELAMNPNGTTWQKHVRGLAKVIEGRGPQGFRSPSSLELITLLRMLVLLESISSKRRTFLSRDDWLSFRGFRPDSSTSAIQFITQSAEIQGPKPCIDYVINELVTISNLTADFAELRDGDETVCGRGVRCPANTESALSESLGVLQRLEAVLGHMQAEIGMLPPGPSGPSSGHQLGPASAAVTTSSPSPSPGSALPAGATRFLGQPLQYNLTSLCRTAAMTLRLLMCDLIHQQGGVDRDRSLQEHRSALMVHAEAVLQAIPYSSRSEIFDAAPMCFVPAFRMAEAVLAKEGDVLRTEIGRESELVRCDAMKELIRCHLDYVASKKICVKIDVLGSK